MPRKTRTVLSVPAVRKPPAVSAKVSPIKTADLPDPGKQRELFREISVNRNWTLGLTPTRLYNPDELVGLKGLRVYREVRRDDQVKAALALKKHAILSTGWRIVPAPGGERVGAFVEHCLREELEGSFDDDLNEILGALDFGFSCSETVWKPILDGKWRGYVALAKLATRMQETFTFRVDPYDNLLPSGVEQFGKPLPTSRFVIYAHSKEYDNYWCFIYCDRSGLPYVKSKYYRFSSYSYDRPLYIWK